MKINEQLKTPPKPPVQHEVAQRAPEQAKHANAQQSAPKPQAPNPSHLGKNVDVKG